MVIIPPEVSRANPPLEVDGRREEEEIIHQEFQVPKMEVLNLIRLFWG